MLKFDAMETELKDLSTIEKQYYLQHIIAPRPICFASTIDKEGNVNLSPFSFFNLFSTNPPIVIFSPSRRVRDNTTKHSLQNILEVPEVVINMVTYDMVHQTSQAYKLFLPADAQRIESTLRQIGMGSMVDRAILQINRAAEDAVGYARPIFLDAIREITITDAINIIRGPNDAATKYFRQKTTDKLIAAFSPVIKSSLDKFSATKYYTDVVNTYNNFPTTLNKLNPDLPSYVVGKAVDALFDQIGQEEANIRANPVARTTEILKKVFGWGSRQ